MNKTIPQEFINFLKLSTEKQMVGRFLKCKTSVEKVNFALDLLSEYNLEKLICSEIEQKSQVKADAALQNAQHFLQQEKYDQALLSLNESLCFAPGESQLFGKLYGFRAKIYYNLSMFQACLDNIGLAIEHGAIKDPDLELDKIRTKCLNSLLVGSPFTQGVDYNEEEMLLSYPPYPNIPNVAECVKLKIDKIYGRVLVSDRDLKPGDVIMMETPYAPVIDAGAAHKKCTNCLSFNNYNLIPCPYTPTAMFCDKNCYQAAMKRFYNYERDISVKLKEWGNLETQIAVRLLMISINSFNDLNELEALNCAVNQRQENQFDFDFQEYDKYTIFKTFCSLTTVESDRSPEDLLKKAQITAILYRLLMTNQELSLNLINTRHENLVKSILYQFLQVTTINTFNMWSLPEMLSKNAVSSASAEDFGIAMYPLSSFLGHSCAPNVRKARAGKDHEKMLIFVIRPIKAGEKICDCYDQQNNHMNRGLEERRAVLYDQYFFICQCEACINDYPQEKNLKPKLKASEWNSILPSLQITTKNTLDTINNNNSIPIDDQMFRKNEFDLSKEEALKSIENVGNFLNDYDFLYPSTELILGQKLMHENIRKLCTKPYYIFD